MSADVVVVRKARPGARLPVGDVQVAEGLVLSFTPGKLFGAVAVGAVLPRAAVRFDEGLARIKKIPDYILPPDGAFVFDEDAPTVPALREHAPAFAVGAERGDWDRNGWLTDDFSATASDLSPTTGLLNIQMTACAAPAGWAELRATHYPWQLPGWTPPTPEWVAPVGMVSKVKAKDADAAPVILTMEADVLVEPLAGSEPVPVASDVPAEAAEDVDAPTTDYPEASIEAALDILKPLAAARKTALPLGQANLALSKAGLPPVSSSRNLKGLLAR
jgi:hypothetical protein